MAHPVTLLSLGTFSPPYVMTQDEALTIGRDVLAPEFADFERMSKVFAIADLDTIVTASSTGIATSGLEVQVMGHIAFRQGVTRNLVFGLGWAAGTSGLGLAALLAQSAPGSLVLLITVGLSSFAFLFQEVGKADIIATALFGAGATAAIVKTDDEGFATITASAQTTCPDALGVMGWRIEEAGLVILLNRHIPALVRQNLRTAMDTMLSGQDLSVEKNDRFICHPGGARVVDAIEHSLALDRGALDLKLDVLRDYGKMWAPTALFVLDRFRQGGMPPLPGFTMSTVTRRAAA